MPIAMNSDVCLASDSPWMPDRESSCTEAAPGPIGTP